ncbi:hypothetical protein CSW64_08415 [Caulobacter mirabilis]|uniref:Alpha-glutamyl/putrescinyl thymine pyrophosphorylase clade 3 domain-containing protein n=1 Tax=Caulobacter mirabilis TaxID=69666 RepID=A0A2D2AWT4_9CAUL|nr:hypothetical protein CSW64_08415 [Caulobacter mirabilis]
MRQMIDSLHRIEFARQLGQRSISPGRMDPTSPLFDPVRAAYLHDQAGNKDEAAWLIFLSTHFGFHRRWKWELTRRVYGALGQGPNWTWARTSGDIDGFRHWFNAHAAQLQGVPFGNHRKYESIRPGADNNLADTVASYIEWVGANRGFALLVADIDQPPSNPRTRFDRLYRASPIVQFGRTAKFDFLTMIGKLNIADIEPPLPYLQGATGPTRGAKLLIANNPTASIPVRHLSDIVVDLGTILDVGMQVMEDSLCNWQKSQFEYVAFRG